MVPAPALNHFDLELERVRLRAALAVARSGSEPSATVVDRLERELAETDSALVPLRAAGGRMDALAARLGLGSDDVELLWSAVGAAVDPRLQPHLVLLGGGDARRGLTLACHAVIAGLDGARARALSRALLGDHPLRRHHLLTVAAEVLSPAARALCAPARLCTWLAGEDRLDPELGGAAEVVDTGERRFRDGAQEEELGRLRHALGAKEQPALVVEGPPGAGRRTAVATVARELGRAVVALDLRRLSPSVDAIESALVALHRECVLRDAIALVADVDDPAAAIADPLPVLHAVAHALDAIPGPVAVTATLPGVDLPVQRPLVRLRYGVPEPPTRQSLWRAALGDSDGTLDVDLLVQRYRLGPGGIRRAVQSARLLVGADHVTTPDLVAGVRSNIAERLGGMAQRIEVRQSWADLILAPDILDQANALVARVRHAHRVLEEWGFGDKLPRGTGVAALFSGPPGTGKTMLAGILARELDLELYQVDLSKVVSKWVGETEKQLARIFEAADAGHALLLFDEADALFARRTEVKSAVDRYANLEVNYLLQRIETFGGMTILTTNLEASIDPALRRRLAAHIAFWPPDAVERDRLWRLMLNARGPVASDVDYAQLAGKYAEMTGANIRNAVLSAAFVAASRDVPIGHALLDRAARAEYTAMGRVLRGA